MTDAHRDDNVRQAVPFFGVSNMEASLRFYVEGLGFTRTDEWVDDGTLRWCWLELGGAAVMLQTFENHDHHEPPPDKPSAAGMTIYFICRDALDLYRGFRARGIAAKRPFVGNAMWVTTVTDPDGYTIHFESPTDAPEESEYDG